MTARRVGVGNLDIVFQIRKRHYFLVNERTLLVHRQNIAEIGYKLIRQTFFLKQILIEFVKMLGITHDSELELVFGYIFYRPP